MNQTTLATNWSWTQSLMKQEVGNPMNVASIGGMYPNILGTPAMVNNSAFGNYVDQSHLVKTASSSPFLLSSNPLDTSTADSKKTDAEDTNMIDKKKKGRRNRKETSSSSPSLLPSKRRSEPNVGSGDDSANSGSSSENGKGSNLGKRSRESYACLRHRAMHKRCPTDCPDRRIPRPLPVAQERKQVNLKEIRLKYKQDQLAKAHGQKGTWSGSPSPSTSPSSTFENDTSDPASPMTTASPMTSTSNIPALLGNLALGSVTTNLQRVVPAPNAFVPQSTNAGNMAQMFGFPSELGSENLVWEGGLGATWDYSDWSGSDLVLSANKESWDELKSGSQWEESKLADLLNGEFGSNSGLDLETVDSYISSGSGSSSDEEDDLRNQLLNSQPTMTVNSIVIDSNDYNSHQINDSNGNMTIMGASGGISNIAWEKNGDAPRGFSSQNLDHQAITGTGMVVSTAGQLSCGLNQHAPMNKENDSPNAIDLDTLKNLIPQVVLSRDALERWARDPYFNRLISGFYIRVPVQERNPVIVVTNLHHNNGDATTNLSAPTTSRFGIIVEGKDFCFDPYRINTGDIYGSEGPGITTTKGLVIQLVGSSTPTVIVPISSVLNSRLSDCEVEQWMKEIIAGGFTGIAGINGTNPLVIGKLPKIQEIQEKAKIVEALNNKYPPLLWRHLQQQQQPPLHLHSVHTH